MGILNCIRYSLILTVSDTVFERADTVFNAQIQFLTRRYSF